MGLRVLPLYLLHSVHINNIEGFRQMDNLVADLALVLCMER